MYTITLSVNLHALDEGNINTIYEFSKRDLTDLMKVVVLHLHLNLFSAGPTLVLGDERDRRTGGVAKMLPAFHKDITIT